MVASSKSSREQQQAAPMMKNENDTMHDSDTKYVLPTAPHPAVKAFTNALKISLGDSYGNVDNSDGVDSDKATENNCPSCEHVAAKKKKPNSHFIQKISQTLGWRNRYSQSKYYPLEINFNESSSTGADALITTKKSITIQIEQVQRGEIENTYGTGATVWPASLVLVKYLEHHILLQQRNMKENDTFSSNLFTRNTMKRRMTIADLGAGTGVTSIAAAYFLGLIHPKCDTNNIEGPFIVCTDGVDSVVELAKENIKSSVAMSNNDSIEDESGNCCDDITDMYNIGRSKVKARKYLWGDGSLCNELKCLNNGDNKYTHFDIILVSDCVLPKLYPIKPLVEAIDELSSKTTVTYMSYEYRYFPEYDPKEFFINAVKERGFEVRTVPLEEQHPIYSVDDIEIWEVKRISNAS